MKEYKGKLVCAGMIVVAWTVTWVALTAIFYSLLVVGQYAVSIPVFIYTAYVTNAYFKYDSMFTRYFTRLNVALVVMLMSSLLYYCLTFRLG
jgi:hypothetical protein